MEIFLFEIICITMCRVLELNILFAVSLHYLFTFPFPYIGSTFRNDSITVVNVIHVYILL